MSLMEAVMGCPLAPVTPFPQNTNHSYRIPALHLARHPSFLSALLGHTAQWLAAQAPALGCRGLPLPSTSCTS